MATSAVRFAVTSAALLAAHEFADYWGQRNTDAQAKGLPGRKGRAACTRHVAGYTATQAAALWAANRGFQLGIRPGRAVLGLAVSAVSHYAADRSAGHWDDEEPTTLLPRLADRLGKTPWTQADPTAGPLLDQSWHKTFIAVAAAVIAAGTDRTGGTA
jgi:hypothetical protein